MSARCLVSRAAGAVLLCLLLAGCGLVSFTVTNSPDVICPNPRTGPCNP